MFFFFFKQKTAYEMRISDWSSDVCSSDLLGMHGGDTEFLVFKGLATEVGRQHGGGRRIADLRGVELHVHMAVLVAFPGGDRATIGFTEIAHGQASLKSVGGRFCGPYCRPQSDFMQPPAPRSEEHTSELQSLMRISYAVFCLKKKKNKQTTQRL